MRRVIRVFSIGIDGTEIYAGISEQAVKRYYANQVGAEIFDNEIRELSNAEIMTPHTDPETGKKFTYCAAWKRIVEGPAHARRTLVYRCDQKDGHGGKHLDHVLLVSWPDEESAEECRPRNELAAPTPPEDRPGDVLAAAQCAYIEAAKEHKMCDHGSCCTLGMTAALLTAFARLRETVGATSRITQWAADESGMDYVDRVLAAAQEKLLPPH